MMRLIINLLHIVSLFYHVNSVKPGMKSPRHIEDHMKEHKTGLITMGILVCLIIFVPLITLCYRFITDPSFPEFIESTKKRLRQSLFGYLSQGKRDKKFS